MLLINRMLLLLLLFLGCHHSSCLAFQHRGECGKSIFQLSSRPGMYSRIEFSITFFDNFLTRPKGRVYPYTLVV